jgi:hypothetical protein
MPNPTPPSPPPPLPPPLLPLRLPQNHLLSLLDPNIPCMKYILLLEIMHRFIMTFEICWSREDFPLAIPSIPPFRRTNVFFMIIAQVVAVMVFARKTSMSFGTMAIVAGSILLLRRVDCSVVTVEISWSTEDVLFPAAWAGIFAAVVLFWGYPGGSAFVFSGLFVLVWRCECLR